MVRAILLSFLILLFGACVRNPATGHQQLNLVPESQEIQMGQQAAKEVAQSIGLYKDAKVESYVADLGNKLKVVHWLSPLGSVRARWRSLALDHRRVTPLHLVGGDIFDVVSNVPLVPERVPNPSGSLSVELVLRFKNHFGPRRRGAADHFVRIVYVNVNRYRRRARRLRTFDVVLRELIRQHQRATAEVELGVTDPATYGTSPWLQTPECKTQSPSPHP